MKSFNFASMGSKIKMLMSAFVVVFLLVITSGRVYAATLYVDKSGNDSSPGTQSQPFLTINKAAQMAYPGDTVLVNSGVYRECVQPLRGGTSDTSRIIYKAATGATVAIKGSEQINNWVQYNGNTWMVSIPNSYFQSYNPYTAGQGLGTDGWFPMYTCGDVYLNGDAFFEKGSIAEVNSENNTWYVSVNSNSTTIYANFSGFNPNTNLAEINVRKQCFAPAVWGLGYITVDGFTVAQSANSYSDFPGAPIHAQAGAISVNGGLKWIIQNNTVINARSIGIDIGLGCDEWAGNRPGTAKTYYYSTDQYGQHIVKNNFISKCGQSGISGVFSWKSQVLSNTIEKTNYRNEFCAAETAGIKLHYDNDGLIQGNYVKDTIGGIVAGIYTDWGNQGIRITQNIMVNNATSYYAEAVVGPILVDNNLFINNDHLRTLDAGGIIFAHNLFYNETAHFDGSGRDCYVFTPHSMTSSSVMSSVDNYRSFNNIYIGCSAPTLPGTNSKSNYNCSNVGSGFTYKATSSSFSCNFNMDSSPLTGHPYITDAYIGNIQPANQGIGVSVDKDYFGNTISTTATVAGPFNNMKNGANSYTLWPRPGITPPPPPASATNLALYQPVTASSLADGTVAANAVDGGLGTRWSSAYSDPQWIYVDLGATKNITSVKLTWEAAYGKAYKIQVSDDASSWTDAYSTATGDGGVDQLYFNARARYVRMYGTQRGTTYGYSLYEFEVYGDGSNPPPSSSNLALNKPVTVSSIDDVSRPASNAVDGNTTTRWSSAFSDTQWIYVDLGSTKDITEVKLTWEVAYGKAYKIQVSNDASSWTDAYSTTTGDGGVDDITLNATGRYVRMYGTVRGTQYGYSLWEFEVY